MIKGIENTNALFIFSQDAARLAKFYEEKVGLNLLFCKEVGKGRERLYYFLMKEGGIFYIVDATKKMRDELARNIINFEVEGIESETRRLEDMGIKKVYDVYPIEQFGYVSAFEDLDGNYFQLIEQMPIMKNYTLLTN